jgi:uncharacterized repeat protein (TIGR01451 family)
MWRRAGQHAVPVALAAALLFAGPASAQFTPTPDPLPGSTFQGGDGNQDDTPAWRDWQAVEQTGSFVHRSDRNDQDSAFERGSKEDAPEGWDLGVEAGGVTPSASNIRDAWGTIEQLSAETFLQLAFSRQASGGSSFLTFELNHDRRLWNNGMARIPCRRDGDVQIAYVPHGNTVDVELRRWDTGTTDARTGCDRTGDFADVANPPANAAQAAINADPIDNYLPGFQGDRIGDDLFGEASLRMAAVLRAAFGDDCLAFGSVWMYSRGSDEPNADMKDYVAPHRLNLRTCSASGTKFFDLNANGTRESNEPGVPRFMIWADYDNDGVRDGGEPFGITDNEGHYVIHDIRPPSGTYTLREQPFRRRPGTRPVSGDWRCSRPNASTEGGTASPPDDPLGCSWGPIDVRTTPNAEDRDFGNWFPAQLTVKKQLSPPGDPGRFNLFVNGNPVLTNAGDGAQVTIPLPPGTYDVSEEAAGGTNLADYNSSVQCRRRPTSRSARRDSVVWENLELAAGDRARCVFRNIRPGSPAIAIEKVATPGIATAGDTLRYTFLVSNVGDVPFPAAAVRVTDPNCDDDPVRVDRQGGPLQPDQTWIFRCSRRTSDGGADCEPTRVDNTGTVVVEGTTVDDSDDASVFLRCPDQPIPPDPVPPDPPGPEPPPDPDEPGPVVPPGPAPPDAGAAARAGAIFRRAVSGCIHTRVPRVNLRGTRIASVRVFVNGRLRRGLNVRTLQQRVRPRVTLGPGRYRVTARVTFQRGTGSPPVSLSGVLRICGASAPNFTG